MGISPQQVMRNHMELFQQRDLLLTSTCLQGVFDSQHPGDACLIEGGVVHRGPAMNAVSRIAFGRLQLFWVVAPTYHFEVYNSNSQIWVGELELQMAVDAPRSRREELVARAATHIAMHSHDYPSFDKMPWDKLVKLYEDHYEELVQAEGSGAAEKVETAKQKLEIAKKVGKDAKKAYEKCKRGSKAKA